jgi:hypothetical protein
MFTPVHTLESTSLALKQDMFFSSVPHVLVSFNSRERAIGSHG